MQQDPDQRDRILVRGNHPHDTEMAPAMQRRNHLVTRHDQSVRIQWGDATSAHTRPSDVDKQPTSQRSGGQLIG